MYHWRLGKHILFLSSLRPPARLYHTPLILAQRRFLASVAPVLRDLLLARTLHHPFNSTQKTLGDAGMQSANSSIQLAHLTAFPRRCHAACRPHTPNPRSPPVRHSYCVVGTKSSTIVSPKKHPGQRSPCLETSAASDHLRIMLQIERAGRIVPSPPAPTQPVFGPLAAP